MPNWTATEIQEAHDRIEENTALQIGRFIIEFSRLEMNLGLAIAWQNGGSDIDQNTNSTELETFGCRLKRWKQHIENLPDEKREARDACLDWIASAELIRGIRNEFIHGRWGIRATEGGASNVISLPTSPSQREVFYTLHSLSAQVQRVIDLNKNLSNIRKKWPHV